MPIRALFLILVAAIPSGAAEPFSFEVDGNRLVGTLTRPADREALGTIVVVHGYGRTSVVENDWYPGIRARFAAIGLNTLMFDKPGCGESGGSFDINQPVASSAEEVVAAIRALRERKIPGGDRVGLWGASRAGWIAPLAMQSDPSIAFWISVSGTDDKENAPYLLERNLKIEGRSDEEIARILEAWQAAFDATWNDGSYEDYLAAAKIFSADPFVQFMGWGTPSTEEGFRRAQEPYRSGEFVVEGGEHVHVPGLGKLLASLDAPVLAIFGEKDTNVDWRKTAKLYRDSIESLTIRTFPDANHILKPGETGGIREMLGPGLDGPWVEGYVDTMIDWLVDQGFGKRVARSIMKSPSSSPSKVVGRGAPGPGATRTKVPSSSSR